MPGAGLILLGLVEDLPAVEIQEPLLVGPDLVNVDVVVAGVGELLDRSPMSIGVRAADNLRGDVVLGKELGHLLEVARECELLAQLTWRGGVRPPVERGLPGRRLVLCPADGELPDPRLVGSTSASNSERSSSSGAVPIRPSPAVAASFAAFGLLAATMMGGGSSGSV